MQNIDFLQKNRIATLQLGSLLKKFASFINITERIKIYNDHSNSLFILRKASSPFIRKLQTENRSWRREKESIRRAWIKEILL